MQIASDISRRITVKIPDAVSVLEGQMVTSAGALYTSSTAVGGDGFAAGVLMTDTLAVATYDPNISNCIPLNAPRCAPAAREGLVPIRVKDLAAYTALTVDGRFGSDAGNAVPVGAGFFAATIGSGYNPLVVKAKVRAASGAYFIIVEVQ